MDPDEVIILAPPQHAIKAHRIKYFEDPVFKAMMDSQEGLELPYPPMRKQTPVKSSKADVSTDNKTADKNRKRARRLKVDLSSSSAVPKDPSTLDPNMPVPDNWIDALNGTDNVDLGLD